MWGPAGTQPAPGLEWAEIGPQCDLHGPRRFASTSLFSPKILKIVFYSGVGIDKCNVKFSKFIFPF